MDRTPVKVGIVGCGSISTIYFENLTKRFKNVEIKSCTSRGGLSAQKKAKQYGVAYCTFEEMLADPEIEIILNLTPAPQHESIIKAALEAGKHVYTEKVIAPEVETAKELIELAESKNLYLCCAPEHFMGAAWQSVRELIDRGMIGQVTSVYATVASNISSFADLLGFVNEPGGGTGFDFGIYLMTTMAALLGPVKNVCGMLRTMQPERTHRQSFHPQFGEKYTYINEDLLSGTVEFESGVVGTIHMDGNTVMPHPYAFKIFGTEGVLECPNPASFSGEVKIYRAGSPEPVNWPSAHGLPHDSRGVGVADMAWAIRLNRAARTDAKMGLHCLEVLCGMKESSETGRYYEVKSSCERPAPLPNGHVNIPFITFDEDGAIVF